MISLNFKIGDANYSYNISGQGPPIVLLHGFTGRISTWTRFVKRWRQQYQVITVDLPGHGLTRSETPRTMKTCCDDLKALFEHLQIPSVHLVGYSMGGRTALSFAMMYPQYVNTLTLESASPGLRQPKERAARRAQDEKLIQKIETYGLTAFVDFWENIPLFESQKKLSTNVQKQLRAERLSQSSNGLIRSLRYMGTGQQPSWWEQLHQYKGAVLLIVGKLDEKFVTINKHMEKHFQRAELAIVEHAGHAVHLEKPEAFQQLVINFIQKHTPNC